MVETPTRASGRGLCLVGEPPRDTSSCVVAGVAGIVGLRALPCGGCIRRFWGAPPCHDQTYSAGWLLPTPFVRAPDRPKQPIFPSTGFVHTRVKIGRHGSSVWVIGRLCFWRGQMLLKSETTLREGDLGRLV